MLIGPSGIAILATARGRRFDLLHGLRRDGIFNIVVVAWWAWPSPCSSWRPFIKWGTTLFGVTDRRVMYRTGVFNKSGIDIPIARINSVQFRHDFIDRLFGAGTLIIESASDEPLEFNDIPHVEKVHKLLYDELNDELHDEGRG